MSMDTSMLTAHVLLEVVTQATVRLQLADEDAAWLRDGESFVLHDKISPSLMIMTGLELEELQ